MKKLTIIDGNSLISRAFYALPFLSNSKGEYLNGVYGFINILIKGIMEIKPDYLIVAFDHGRITFRNDIYSMYKGNRRPTPVELKSQFPILKDILDAMGIRHIEEEGFEADDIIGTLSRKFKGVKTIIITGDRDALQLLSVSTDVWLTKKGISEVKIYNKDTYKAEYGLYPTQIIDLKALMGDSSDNIPGVSGVGEKTALSLMQEWKSLDNIYKNLDKIKPKISEKLKKDKDNAYMSKALSTINTKMKLPIKLESLRYAFPFNQKVFDIFKRYEFNSLLKRTDLFKGVSTDDKFEKYSANIIEIKDRDFLERQIKHIRDARRFNFDITNSKLSFAYDKNCEFFCSVQSTLPYMTLKEVLEMLRPILEDENIVKCTYDIKGMKHILSNFNIDLKGANFDCILAYYLLVVGDRGANKKNLLLQYSLDEDYDAVNLFYLEERLRKNLEDNKLKSLYDNVEFPLIDVLYSMEKVGCKIDKKVLESLKEKYSVESRSMENSIKKLAGENFNVNSPKKLGEILFDKLGLYSPGNKKKSTGIEALQAIYNLHPIVPLIIRYRKIKKVLSTYLEAYETMIDKGSLIHTIFHQTLTNTGRLSSTEPNLQNLPVRDEETKNIRKMFVSRYDGGELVGADYSQVELRLLAHFSQDENLIRAFKNGVDIHSVTASEVFSVPIEKVDAKMRRAAKAVNFGIIYGISEYGLAQNIDTSRKQAKLYIEKYFERYPKVKLYMDSNVKKAKETGYAYTLFGRRRKIDEISSPNSTVRKFGERVAMNMPLQGSVSDLIKLAMIRIHNFFLENDMKSRIILQVHDELIVDAPQDEISKVSKVLKDIMENIVNLSVPLTVDVSSGKTWYEC